MGNILTPMRAIRARCIDCADTIPEVKLCPCTDCPLYPYRMGHSPNKRQYSPEVLEAKKEHMRRIHRQRIGKDAPETIVEDNDPCE